MNARHLAHAQPLSFSAPATIEASFRLTLLEGDDNPLRSAGMLSISGRDDEMLPEGTIKHATKPVSAALESPPTLSVALHSSGHRLLALDLEVIERGEDVLDPLEVRMTSRGLLPEHADCLGIATGTYAWRLSGHFTLDEDDRLHLTIELAQELAPGDAVVAIDGVMLPFHAGDGDEPTPASIKVRRLGTDIQIDHT